MLVRISRDTFRTFCNGLRHAIDASVSNTAMMEIVSTSLGWRRDALTHHLKSNTLPIEIEDGFLRTLVSRINSQTGAKLLLSDVKPLFDNFAMNGLTSPAAIASGSEEEWQRFRRVAILLEARQADAANEFARQLNENTPVIRLLKGLIGIALDQVGAEENCVSALRNHPSLIHPLANLSGIELNKPITKFEDEQPWDQIAPIKRLPLFPLSPVDEAFFPRGVKGGLGHKHDEDRFFRVIGGLRRPELKGRAYRAVVDAGIVLPADFQQYLEPTPPSRTGDKTVCLIDGIERILMKSYLKNKYGINTGPYLAFFDVTADALLNPSFAESKTRFARK